MSNETFDKYLSVRREILAHRQVETIRELPESVLMEELRTRGLHRGTSFDGQAPNPGLFEMFLAEWASERRTS